MCTCASYSLASLQEAGNQLTDLGGDLSKVSICFVAVKPDGYKPAFHVRPENGKSEYKRHRYRGRLGTGIFFVDDEKKKKETGCGGIQEIFNVEETHYQLACWLLDIAL